MIALVLLAALLVGGQEPVQDSSALTQEVLKIQRAKCLDCHNADSEERKAKRKYPDALDLASTVEEFVVPGDPNDSDLILMLEDGEMPPDDSDVAPITAAELEVYRQWILNGASILPQDDQVKVEVPVGLTKQARLRKFVGRLHPAVVHFPIGLILSAAFLELLILIRRRISWLNAQSFCIRFGAFMGVVAATLGVMLTEFTRTTNELWLHGSLAGVGLLCALIAAKSVPKGVNAHRNRFRLWVGAATVFIGGAGFMGGYLVFGWEYLKY